MLDEEIPSTLFPPPRGPTPRPRITVLSVCAGLLTAVFVVAAIVILFAKSPHPMGKQLDSLNQVSWPRSSD